MVSEPLVCPRCAATYSLEERFCAKCKLPLVYSASDDAERSHESEAHMRARKIKPQFTRGELVKVGWGRNQSEAEMIQMMLLDQGIPTTVRRSAGFDVPDFLAAGPRDVMAPESAVEAARRLLGESELLALAGSSQGGGQRPKRLLAGIIIALAALGAIIWVLFDLAK